MRDIVGNHNSRAVVLLASYNGAAFLREQLTSLQAQSFSDWDLIVSDDGSTDGTLEVLEEFRQREPRLVSVLRNRGPHGAFANFFHLMRYVRECCRGRYGYFFFCDQDDVWLPDKMLTEVQRLDEVGAHGREAALVYADMELMDGEGQDSGTRLSEITDLRLRNPADLFFSNKFVWGTSLAFNAALWERLPLPDVVPSYVWHDHYVARYAAAFGRLSYIDRPLVHYRRHGHNVSGLPHRYSLLQAARLACQQFWQVAKGQGEIYAQVLFLIQHVPEKTPFLEEYERSIRAGGLRALRFVRKWHVTFPGNLYSRIGFYLVLGTGAYRRGSIFRAASVTVHTPT